MISSGEVLDGYRLIRRIGAGGFGEVWICRNEAFGDLRALKFVPSSDKPRLDREHAALSRYRRESGRLLNKTLMPIEHANLRADGMFYIMPLADGTGSSDATADEWRPVTLASLIKGRASSPCWFSSGEVKALITPVLKALQMLDDVRLVHRDVKPENILFRDGTPCLSDISLLDGDLKDCSRSGTYGYGAPVWFLEAGGHPDMYGVAATLFVLLTGKSPDKMAQSRHRWPPCGEESLPENERMEWQNMHRLIARATDEDPGRRFLSFSEFDRTLNRAEPEKVPEPLLMEIRRLENELETARLDLRKQRDEFEKVLESTMKALEKPSRGDFWQFAGAGERLAAVAEQFEAGLTAAKSGTRWIRARELMRLAMQTWKAAGEAHDPAIVSGLEELRSGFERMFRMDREFLTARVREVLARAQSLSGIGSLAKFNVPVKLAGLLEGPTIRRLFNLEEIVAPAVLPRAEAIQDAAASLARILGAARAFLEDQKNDFPGEAERSTET